MECCHIDTRRYFLLGMRVYFGLWLLYVGLMKWLIFGPPAFVGMITTDFDKTWSPHALNVLLAWVIIIVEPLLSLWILSGKRARSAWTITSLLMFLLLIGQTILMKDAVANWHFVVLTLLCAALAKNDEGASAV